MHCIHITCLTMSALYVGVKSVGFWTRSMSLDVANATFTHVPQLVQNPADALTRFQGRPKPKYMKNITNPSPSARKFIDILFPDGAEVLPGVEQEKCAMLVSRRQSTFGSHWKWLQHWQNYAMQNQLSQHQPAIHEFACFVGKVQS